MFELATQRGWLHQRGIRWDQLEHAVAEPDTVVDFGREDRPAVLHRPEPASPCPAYDFAILADRTVIRRSTDGALSKGIVDEASFAAGNVTLSLESRFDLA